MRRSEREIKEHDRIIDMLNQNKVLRLAMINQGKPYVVPLNYGYEYIEGQFIFYIHSAKDGKKIECIDQNPYVCLEMDSHHQLIEGDIACQYGYHYQSLIASGIGMIVESAEEKKKGLSLLMTHQTGKEFEITEAQTENVAVIKVIVESISAKEH